MITRLRGPADWRRYGIPDLRTSGLPDPRTPESSIRKRQELLPVVVRHIVRARPHVEAERAVERRLVHTGHLGRQLRRRAEQGVDRLGRLGGEEGAARIAPEVVLRNGDIDRARRNEGDELVLI